MNSESMLHSAVTVSLVPEAKGGPFVYWDGLEDAFGRAAEFGFDAIEIFAPGPDHVDIDRLRGLVAQHAIRVAAVGTGAGAVKHGLTLTDPDAVVRQQAVQFVERMIDFGASVAAPAIIGSMQGRWSPGLDRNSALEELASALDRLGAYAESRSVPLIYEPLNRYETNLINTVEATVSTLASLDSGNVKLLADLFHMNIEEASLPDAIRSAGNYLAHVHFVDSNRWAVGYGHTAIEPVVDALREIGFQGCVSIEAFPLPDSNTAAKTSIEAFHHHFRDWNAGVPD